MAVWLTGDTHGFHNLKQRLSQFTHKKAEGENILIVLGDFGLLWDRKEYGGQVKAIQLFIDKYLPNFTLAFLAGNHENYDLIDNLKTGIKWENEVGVVSRNIFHLRTGKIYTMENETYAIYGGGVSIDRHRRVENVSWWAREIPSIEEYKNLIDELWNRGMEVDYLLTHTMAEDEIRLVDRFPFTDKLTDPVARDIKIIKQNIVINKYHAFGHFHIDKDLSKTIYKIRSFFEDIEKI